MRVPAGLMFPPDGMTTQKLRTGLPPHITGLDYWIWLVVQENTADPVVEVSATWDSFFKEEPAVVTLEPFVVLTSGNLSAEDVADIGAWAAANINLIDDYFTGRLLDAAEVVRRTRPLGTMVHD